MKLVDHIQAPGRGTTWRPLGKKEVLPDCEQSSPDGLVLPGLDFGQVLGGGGVPGERRCSAIGLQLGDCTQQHIEGSRYCYYHDKVQKGVIDSFMSTNSSGGWYEESPRNIYPVWPLPVEGYWLLDRAMPAEVAA